MKKLCIGIIVYFIAAVHCFADNDILISYINEQLNGKRMQQLFKQYNEKPDIKKQPDFVSYLFKNNGVEFGFYKNKCMLIMINSASHMNMSSFTDHPDIINIAFGDTPENVKTAINDLELKSIDEETGNMFYSLDKSDIYSNKKPFIYSFLFIFNPDDNTSKLEMVYYQIPLISY